MILFFNKFPTGFFRHIIVLVFVFGIGSLYSQAVVQGKIRDANNNPIEFATVQLLFNDVYNQSAVSDSLGNYLLKSTKTGHCKIKVNMLGYFPAETEFVLQADTTVDFVMQIDTTILDEVIITGRKNLIQAKPDGYIINIGGNIEIKGKQTLDILKQLPNINASRKSLNIFGKPATIVYINDRIVRLQGQALISYLNSLPPNIIKSVEIITTPPAQYDAEGNVGIIKIIADKNILPGWKEYLKAAYTQNSYSSYVLSGYANYTGKRMFFETVISGGSYTYLNQSNYYSYFPGVTITTFNPKKWNYQGTKIHTTLGYDFTKNSNMIFDIQIPVYNSQTITDIENKTDFINPAINRVDSTILSNGKTSKNNYLYNYELFFKHKFSNPQSYFTANVAFLDANEKTERSFVSVTQVNNISRTNENYYTEGDLNYNILTSKMDFHFPFLGFSVNSGLKLSYINTDSDYNFYDIINNERSLDPALSGKYSYEENIQAIYCSLARNINRWSLKAGLRSELTQTTGISQSNINKQYSNRYIDFFPTLYIGYKLNGKNRLSFSYAQRIDRPPYQYLNPFRWYISKYDYAVGNPFLKPSYINSLELNYLFNKTLSVKLYFTKQNDKIGRYVVLDSLNVLNQIQIADNFLDVSSYGITIYKMLKFNKFETFLQGHFAYSQYLSNRKEFSDISGINGTIVINNTISIGKKINLICNFEEGIPGLYNYRTTENYFKLDTGASYTNSAQGFEIRIFASDILKTASPEYYYESGGIKQTYKNYFDTQSLDISFVWKLGNWYNKSHQKPAPSNTEEKRRL